ncbi:MAG: hypothetical protein KME03_00160 [Aphanocapsa lilacina HA4352-LM1]|jgi:hypothetical protein|nr:hypothetical protein [Aphanocapsa lilacina HA4352-LM1]
MRVPLRLIAATIWALLAAPARSACQPQVIAQLPVPLLAEVSGMVRGGSGNFWWFINDSGDGAHLYAVDDSSKLKGKVSVAGANNVDWEDLAAGRCPDGNGRCLFIGDIGNNALKRQDLAIYVVREPEPVSGKAEVLLALPLRYPDRPADAEALVYDEQNRQLVLFTKEFSGLSRVYARSLTPAETVLKPIARLDLSEREIGDNLLSGASISPDGKILMLRSYFTAFRWQRGAAENWEQLLARAPEAIALEKEPQGEALATDGNEGHFFTTSEVKPILMRYPCKL